MCRFIYQNPFLSLRVWGQLVSVVILRCRNHMSRIQIRDNESEKNLHKHPTQPVVGGSRTLVIYKRNKILDCQTRL